MASSAAGNGLLYPRGESPRPVRTMKEWEVSYASSMLL
jgi:hypothetical protein